MAPGTLRALLDLVLPADCAGCACPGTTWCSRCAPLLRGPAWRARPDPCPPDLPPTWAVAVYDGPVREAVVAHKEHGVRALAGPLGSALARSAEAAVGIARHGPVLLVPAPSRAAALRARGDDPTRRLARAAGGRLRARVDLWVAPVLRMAPGTRDQAGLGAQERAANLAGAVRVAGRFTSYVRGVDVVLVDDVVTTGATLAESARALREAGALVVGAAVVAATPRRGTGVSPRSGRD